MKKVVSELRCYYMLREWLVNDKPKVTRSC